jgi:hypothetical protein
MNENAIDTRTMIRYLLGELSDEEKTYVEEKYFAGADYFEQLLDLEDELIYQYVHNKLSQEDRQRLERHFLVSPERREKVKLARALAEYDKREQIVEKSLTTQALESLAAWWRTGRIPVVIEKPAVQWVFATIFLIVTFGSLWLLIENKKFGTQLTQLETKHQEMSQRMEKSQQQLKQARDRTDSLDILFEQVQHHRDSLQKELESTRLLGPALAYTEVKPRLGSQRDVGGPPERELILQGQVVVNFKLSFKDNDTTNSYRAELMTESKVKILSQYKLQALLKGSEKEILWQVPRSAFLNETRRYLICLNRETDPENECRYDFHFRVVKK